ncbi:hypothetical protein [Nocardia amikacinitolerans]|uniref:hypothetical protein n=1 Tax=Nocardia amikacinitolerans TaxID=756689 RepID=UPI0020A58935|nr:hypothetical protein [Nocardia amikacinitolerans]MCP2290786.1 hypothetical protein [Nocardia amikacinitolerans]
MRKISRLAAGISATALVVSGAGIALGSAAAAAAPAAEPCVQSKHVDYNPGISSFWITHTYDKSVDVRDAAAGTLVTYKLVVGTTSIGNPYVNGIVDFPPVGFGMPLKAEVTAYHLGQGQQTNEVTVEPSGEGWGVNSTGWFVNSGNPVTAEFTYKVPDNIEAGQLVVSRGMQVHGTVGVGSEQHGMTVCFTGRDANPGEVLQGSLEDGGFGSSQNGLSSTGSVTDIITDVIKNLIGS